MYTKYNRKTGASADNFVEAERYSSPGPLLVKTRNGEVKAWAGDYIVKEKNEAQIAKEEAERQKALKEAQAQGDVCCETEQQTYERRERMKYENDYRYVVPGAFFEQGYEEVPEDKERREKAERGELGDEEKRPEDKEKVSDKPVDQEKNAPKIAGK